MGEQGIAQMLDSIRLTPMFYIMGAISIAGALTTAFLVPDSRTLDLRAEDQKFVEGWLGKEGAEKFFERSRRNMDAVDRLKSSLEMSAGDAAAGRPPRGSEPAPVPTIHQTLLHSTQLKLGNFIFSRNISSKKALTFRKGERYKDCKAQRLRAPKTTQTQRATGATMAPLGAMRPSAPAILLALLIATSGLSSVLGDHGSHFTVHEYHQSPTCNEPVQEGFGLSRYLQERLLLPATWGRPYVVLVQVEFHARLLVQRKRLRFSSTFGLRGDLGWRLPQRGPDDPDNKYYIKHVSTNLAGMQYDMKEDFVVNRCQVPGSLTPRNDYYDPRDYGKCYEHDNYQTYDLLIAQQAPIIIVSSYGESQSCPSDGGPALNYTALYIPFETCTFVGGMQDPEATSPGPAGAAPWNSSRRSTTPPRSTCPSRRTTLRTHLSPSLTSGTGGSGCTTRPTRTSGARAAV